MNDSICQFYPRVEDETCVCDAGSDISGSHACTEEYSEACQWAMELKEEIK